MSELGLFIALATALVTVAAFFLSLQHRINRGEERAIQEHAALLKGLERLDADESRRHRDLHRRLDQSDQEQRDGREKLADRLIGLLRTPPSGAAGA